MKCFVTGATGYIGRAVVAELLQAGHPVTGLVRTPEKAQALEALGAVPVDGDMNRPEGFRPLASGHEILIHLAFQREGETSVADRKCMDGLLSAASQGTDERMVVYTSGSWVLGATGETPADETAPTDHPAEVVGWRPAHETRVLEAATAGVTTAVIRPGVVYGGVGGLTRRLFISAANEGASEYIAPGDQHWSFVHRDDLAALYRQVVTRRVGGIVHGVDGHPVRMLDAARAASHVAGAGGAVRPVDPAEARERLGAAAEAMRLDQRIITGRWAETNWQPGHRSFLEHAEEAWWELTQGAPGASAPPPP